MSTGPFNGVPNAGRLAALHRTALLDTAAEPAFDQLTRLAGRVLNAPVALLSFVDRDRVFLKSCIGLREPWASRRETPFSHSFCQHVVATGEALVIEDARLAPPVRDSLAIPELGAIAYLGVPLRTPEGFVLGALAVIDHMPRRWQTSDVDALDQFAGCVMSRIAVDTRLREVQQEGAAHMAILDAALDAVIRMDSTGQITGWNPQAAATFGWSAAEAVGRSLADTIVPPQHRSDHQRGLKRFLTTGEARILDRRIEITGWHRSGREFPVELTVTSVRVGGDWHFSAFVRDVTARKLAEQALRLVTDRFTLVSRATTDAVWDWDLIANEVWRSEGFETLFGYGPLDIGPAPEAWYARLHADDRDRVSGGIRAVIDGGGTAWSDEYRFRRADGSYAEVFDRGYVARDGRGRAVRMVGAMMDLTARRAVERRADAPPLASATPFGPG